MEKDQRTLDRACLLLLAGVVALFFAPALTFRGVIFFGDVTHYAPRLAYTGEWVRAGYLPLWNSLLSLGAPHAVDTLVLYPPNLLLSVLLGTWAYNYDVALHVLVAAIGTFSLARTLDLTRQAAVLSAVAYALGGFNFGHLQHLNIIIAAAWIPVAFVTTERYLVTSGRCHMGLAMLAMGLLMLGGHPQIVLYGLLALGAYCAFRLTGLLRAGESRRVLVLTAGLLAIVLVGLALAAAFLLPFAEWIQFVERGERVSAQFATWYSLPPKRLAALIAPFWLGGSPGRPVDASRLVEWSSYVGLLPLALAPVALARRNGRVLFFWCLTLAALLLALGGYTPLYKPLLAVPLLNSVRAPARFLVLAALGLALLAGFGLDSLRAGAGRRLARVVAVALLILAAVLTRGAWLAQKSVGLLPTRPDPIRLNQMDTLVLLATLLGASALLWSLAGRGGDSRSLIALALAFAAIDLFGFQAQLFFYRLAPADTFAEPSGTAEAIRRAGDPPRFYTQTGKELETLVFDRQDFDGYRRLNWESLRNSLPMRFGLQSLTGFVNEPLAHEMLISAIREQRQVDSRAARLAGTFGVRYVIASPDRGVSAPELTLVARGVRDLYRNEVSLPRAYLVPESRVAANERSAFALVRRAAFDPRREVVIEVPGPPTPGGPLGAAQAAIVHEEPNRVVVETVSGRAAWLVLNDTFAPGWKATVDGRRAPILRANALVRTVVVPAGRHSVEFAYAPLSLRLGLAISSAALLVVCGLVFSRRRRAG